MTLFYVKNLGFKVVYTYVSKNTPGLRTVFLKRNKVVIELLKDDNIEGKSISKSHNHIAIEVNNVKKEFERIKKLNIKIKSQLRVTGDGYSEFAIKDYEGNIIEFSKRVKKIISYSVKAVIFDFDGTLVDSEDNYYEADKILLSQYGIDFTKEMKKKYIGVGSHSMMVDIKNTYKIVDSLDYLLELKNKIYMDIATKNTKIYPEMKKFLLLLKKHDYKIALASGSSLDVLNLLTSMLGINSLFDVIVSSESVEKGKPDPAVFLLAAKKLGIPESNIVVVEDSKYGVEAAKRAFMRCIAVPYLIEKPLDDVFLMADLVYKKGINSFKARGAVKWLSGF